MEQADFAKLLAESRDAEPAVARDALHRLAVQCWSQLMGERFGVYLRQRYDLGVGWSSDLHQEGVVALIKNFDQFRGTEWASLLCWARATMCNLARNSLRRKRPEPLVQDTSELALPEAAGPSPSQQAAQAEEFTRLNTVLTKMSAPDQELLHLRYWEVLSWDEVAELLGITSEAARARHHRAMPVLKNLLEEMR